jgi:hypothetical protein
VIRYAVPYTAPGIKWGELRVLAESPAEAVEKARAIHEQGRYRTGYTPRWSGPGAGPTKWRSAPHRLTKGERARIVYGEPLAMVEEGAA